MSKTRLALEAGKVAVYDRDQPRTVYLYHRDGEWYRLIVTESPWVATEQRIGVRALEDKIAEHYPTTSTLDEVHPAVASRVESGTVEALAAAWSNEVQSLIGEDTSRSEVSDLVSYGHRIAKRADGEDVEELVQKRVQELVEAADE